LKLSSVAVSFDGNNYCIGTWGMSDNRLILNCKPPKYVTYHENLLDKIVSSNFDGHN
jgi:hypothetical protein